MWWHSGPGWGMMGYGYGTWWGGHMIVGALFWVVILVLVVAAGQRFFRPQAKGSDQGKTSSALDILQQRYARGEIGREEFMEKKADLSAA